MENEARRPSIYVTDEDRERLMELLRSGQAVLDVRRDLEAELRRATRVASAQAPPDVITMHSTARLVDLDSGQEMICTLVFPNEADPAAGRVSVLAPIGMAMLGYREGDVFEWKVPAGKRRLRVDAVLYQPEAAGDPA